MKLKAECPYCYRPLTSSRKETRDYIKHLEDEIILLRVNEDNLYKSIEALRSIKEAITKENMFKVLNVEGKKSLWERVKLGLGKENK